MPTYTESLFSHAWGKGLCALIEIALVAIVLRLCATTAIIRDTDTDLPNFKDRPFSLAKSQLAFWTVIAAGAFVWIFFDADKYYGIMNDTVLWLLGISSGTTVLSGAAAGGAPAASPPAPSQRHQGYIADILSDNQGVNFHRLQMVIWTLIFGGIFVYQTLTQRAFPTFDDQAFVLMGISSATYVWLKRSEV